MEDKEIIDLFFDRSEQAISVENRTFFMRRCAYLKQILKISMPL